MITGKPHTLMKAQSVIQLRLSTGGHTARSNLPPLREPSHQPIQRLDASVFRISDRTGQLFQSAAGKDLREFAEKSFMHQSVGRDRFAAGNLKFAAGKVRNLSAGFFDDKHPGGSVPGIEIKFPKAVITPGGNIAQIESCRTRPSDAVSAQCELVIKINVRIFMPLLARESSADQAFSQV